MSDITLDLSAPVRRSAWSLERIRHGFAAGFLRRLLYRRAVGGAWPLRFREPRAPSPERACESLYVHVPFCRSLCPHCPYVKVPFRRETAERYREAILGEIRAWLDASPSTPLRHIYFGGGSPGLMPELVEECLAVLTPRRHGETAIGLELHPLDVDRRGLERFRKAGINRVSLGVESLDAEVLRHLGRRYTPSQACEALETAAAAGFACVDVNLMYGVGAHPERSLLDDARVCLAAGVHQISAYPLISFRHTRPAWIPDVAGFRLRDRLHRDLRELCREAGWRQTSVWSFARRGVEPYSTVTLEAYRGFGAGAATRTDDAFWFHTFDVEAYVQPGGTRPALALDADARFFRAHWLYWKIYGLHVPAAEYVAKFGVRPEHDFPWLFRLLERFGVVRRCGEDWHVAPRGADWVHRVQQLYSLAWIDRFWTACKAEPWPREVALA